VSSSLFAEFEIESSGKIAREHSARTPRAVI
jgi:hypothetical protein